MARITKAEAKPKVIQAKTMPKSTEPAQGYKWWKAKSQKDLCDQVISTASYLKEQQQFRFRQAAVFARLYGNMPLFNFAGSTLNKTNSQSLPLDRPTMNVIQSCVDTLVSRVTQSRPRPVFLTDNGSYKERNLAKQLNSFINGELYQTDAYELGALGLRDASALGTGCVKVYETNDKRVGLERVLSPELLVDPNDAYYGCPRSLIQIKLVDRSVLVEQCPEYASAIARAEQAFLDGSSESTNTVADQVMVVEAWHLSSGEDAGDGRHTIACTSGIIFDEEWKKKDFPFAFIHYSPRIAGFWGQGLAEQLMGTQMSINKILIQMDRSIHLITPVYFIEKGAKMVKAHFNNEIGRVQEFTGTMPQYQAPEPYNAVLPDQLQRLVNYAYQQSGISALAATSQKPAGLNSGEAIRNYDDLQTDRFSALVRRYDNFYIDLAYLITDLAKDIAERDGSYSTVYPNKDGTKEIDLPKAAKALEDPVIQCFDSSSLPRDPAGRLATVTEWIQAGMVSIAEGQRLLDFPDLQQISKLANAGEERIYQILDDIIDTGKYTPPDPFMDLELATQIVTKYYNLYEQAKLEESKAQMLRDFFTQVQDLKMAAMPPPMALGAMPPQAVPQAPPVSDLLPNAPTAA